MTVLQIIHGYYKDEEGLTAFLEERGWKRVEKPRNKRGLFFCLDPEKYEGDYSEIDKYSKDIYSGTIERELFNIALDEYEETFLK